MKTDLLALIGRHAVDAGRFVRTIMQKLYSQSQSRLLDRQSGRVDQPKPEFHPIIAVSSLTSYNGFEISWQEYATKTHIK